jgi:superfamily II DNA or RNA helicase
VSGIVLRGYQEDAVDAVLHAADRGIARALGVAPTGSGKTVILSEVINRRTGPGHQTVLLAHRDELLRQAGEKLEMAAPGLAMDIGYVKAGQNEVDKPIIIASVQTLARPSRREQMPRDIDTLVVDEAHHFPAVSYQQTYDWLRPALTLGVTATADRADGKSLEEYFDEQVFGFSIEWMVDEGYLVPPRGRRITVDVDLSKVKKTHGDFQADALADALEDADAITDILAAYLEHGEDRKTLIFCPTVAMAHHTAAVFCDAGLAAEAIDGNTPPDERAAILHRLHTGETQILSNVNVLTEGFDEPSIGCIVLAAPTKSNGKYTQIIGRGLRLWPGKEDCLVLDTVGASADNSLASLPALFGLKDLLDDEDVIEGREREAREAAEAEEAEQEVDPREERRCRNAESIQFFGRGRMNWTTIDDKWTIPLDRFRTIVLWPTAGEHFDVLLLNEDKESFKFLARGLDLGYAQGAAEETIRKHGNRLLADSKAGWREDKVTPGQRGLLKHLRLEVPPTKGEAADLITEAKVSQLLERVERALIELEAKSHDYDLEGAAA